MLSLTSMYVPFRSYATRYGSAAFNEPETPFSPNTPGGGFFPGDDDDDDDDGGGGGGQQVVITYDKEQGLFSLLFTTKDRSNPR